MNNYSQNDIESNKDFRSKSITQVFHNSNYVYLHFHSRNTDINLSSCFCFCREKAYCPIDSFSVCEPGYYRISLFSDCQPCPKNTYSDKDQTYSSCTPCPEGKTTPTTAASSASDCRKQTQFNIIHVLHQSIYTRD